MKKILYIVFLFSSGFLIGQETPAKSSSKRAAVVRNQLRREQDTVDPRQSAEHDVQN